MKKNSKILFILILSMALAPHGFADGPDVKEKSILDSVVKNIRQKIKFSGTLDLYDDTLKKVRNVMIPENAVSILKQGEGFQATIDGRDTHSGARVTVEGAVVNQEDNWEMKDYRITRVQEVSSSGAAKKEYSDTEIREFAQKYLVDQSKFSGSLTLYDEDNKKLRKLKFLNFNEGVKRFGSLLIIRGNFNDVDSNESLSIDVTVNSQDGNLGVQSLLIRGIKK